jgi:cytochrome c oxidase assembly protein subunit 15
LFVLWALVLLMVIVGGTTRLTGSGLSITPWQPDTGILPPLSEAAWQEELAHYRASPEFQRANHWMGLADFKRIYFWEYVHRLLGRLVGFAVLVPFLVFALQRRLSRGLGLKVLLALVLGGLQGVLGWYMVMSGLIEEPRVSPYRLAAHLMLAFLLGQYLLWLALDLARSAPTVRHGASDRRVLNAAIAFCALVSLQCVYGAFMAGTRAGYYFATFPDMDGEFLPGKFWNGPWLHEAVQSPLAIHWIHRFLGFCVLGAAFGLFVWVRRVSTDARARQIAVLIAALTFVQLNLGALTVIERVALPLAVSHQALAYVLLSAGTWLVHRALHAPTSPA